MRNTHQTHCTNLSSTEVTPDGAWQLHYTYLKFYYASDHEQNDGKIQGCNQKYFFGMARRLESRPRPANRRHDMNDTRTDQTNDPDHPRTRLHRPSQRPPCTNEAVRQIWHRRLIKKSKSSTIRLTSRSAPLTSITTMIIC